MLKKLIIVIIGIIAFAVLYNFTGNWKLSLAIIGIIFIYLVWTIGIELGIYFKHKAEEKKDRHIKRTEDNPTLR